MIVKRLILAGSLALSLAAAAMLALDRWVSHSPIPALDLETSVTVLDRDGLLLRAYTVADGRWRLPAGIDDVDPRYLAHLIAYEDKRFYRHKGVDTIALARAAGQALWNGKVVSGGSTLTMQVARLLEGGGTGRWGPKLRQMQLALALERRLGKEEILNLYLKLAPYGGNLEGVRAATLSYFGKEPKRLTAAQSALLVALPQSPETRRPDRAANTALQARNRVLVRLAAAGALSVDEARAATLEVLPSTRLAFPAIAPHLADRQRAGQPLATTHRLTVRRALQQALETLAEWHVNAESDGLSAALLVMDHQSGEILASVGSSGFLDHDRQGFIDMTRAVRSPGSTLKPLIYGLAFEAGLAHPETLMEDRPTAFGTYAPRNFNKEFYGTLSAREALQYSLNIPAVALLEAIGPVQLVARMRRAGVEARLPGDAPPGLAIALGGIGLSLHDLVVLYAAMANGGQPVAVQHAENDAAQSPVKQLMSAEAAWQVGEILTGVVGPELARRGDLAYKTGTSYGYRDAWAIGFDGRHVIGVWLGRPDGASVPGILGADLAAPLLFEAFGRLKPELDPMPPPPPATLIVSHSDLPMNLKHFHGANALFAPSRDAPEIAFPPDGAAIELGFSDHGSDMPLVLKVRNGVPPFTWIADGSAFLIAIRERQAEYQPEGPGFLEISVVDARGRSQKALVELR